MDLPDNPAPLQLSIDRPTKNKEISLAPNTASEDPAQREARLEARLRLLLEGMVIQDESALADFYDATVGKAYGLALRITRQPEAAEEVVEDVYFQVWRDAARFDPARGKVLTWLLTICRSRALDYLRRKDEAELHPDPDEFQSEVAVEGSDPLDILQATECAGAIHKALASLGPLPRQLITLAFFRGLSHQEIADHCKMPLGTVKTTLRRAFEQMRTCLAGSEWEPRQ
jgi:RNA polymerase sigma-70 factor (ECF subfamily)